MTTVSTEVRPAQAAHSFRLDCRLKEALQAFESAYFEFHLAQARGSMTRVSSSTGLDRTHLYRKLKHLGFDPLVYRCKPNTSDQAQR